MALRAKLEGFASDTAELAKTRAAQTLQTVTDEANAHGLVPDGDTIKDMSGRISKVAGAAQDAVKKRMP